MRCKTIWLAMMLALVILTASRVATAQPSKVYRIGALLNASAATANSFFDDFRQGLRDLGYIEGQNLTIEYRYTEGDVERLSDLAAELVRLHVDVIVTTGTPATRAAKDATSMIPIIMTNMGVDPVASGLVSSLARPEGNVTGVTALGAELYEKRLALIKEAVPSLARLAVFVSAANPNSTCRREVTAAAQTLGVQLHLLDIRDAHAFEPAFAAIAQAPPDALLVCWDALTGIHARRIADFAVRHRLPTMTATKAYVQAGALMSYGTSIGAQMRRAADYVDKILKGTKPADLPVERPTQFELILNLQTAQALGLTLPPTLLFQATEVVR